MPLHRTLLKKVLNKGNFSERLGIGRSQQTQAAPLAEPTNLSPSGAPSLTTAPRQASPSKIPALKLKTPTGLEEGQSSSTVKAVPSGASSTPMVEASSSASANLAVAGNFLQPPHPLSGHQRMSVGNTSSLGEGVPTPQAVDWDGKQYGRPFQHMTLISQYVDEGNVGTVWYFTNKFKEEIAAKSGPESEIKKEYMGLASVHDQVGPHPGLVKLRGLGTIEGDIRPIHRTLAQSFRICAVSY